VALGNLGFTRATRKVIFAEHVEKDLKPMADGIQPGSAAQTFPDAEAELRKHFRRIRPRRLRVRAEHLQQRSAGSQPWSIRSHI